VGKFAVSTERQKSKVFQLQRALPPTLLTLDSAGAAPQTTVYRGLTVAFGDLQLSSASTD